MRWAHVLPAALLATVAMAAPSEDTGWKALQKRYEELARNHDDEANRERRFVLLDMFPFREEKACRKLLKEAWDDEKSGDNRVAVVHLLAGCGDSKALDALIADFKKERARAPLIALGKGLGYTPDAARDEIVERVLKHLKKAKDDVRMSLIRGLGELGRPGALEWLREPGDLTPAEWFERNLALGLCGGAGAVPDLAAQRQNALAEARLGAVAGLAAIPDPEAAKEIAAFLADADDRVVRRAAAALAEAGDKGPAAQIADALARAPSLRSREDLRAALRTLLGRDLGHDAEAWKALAAGGDPPAPSELPQLPVFCGLPVASDSFALLVDTSRSTVWNDRLKRIQSESVAFLRSLPPQGVFDLAATTRDVQRFSESGVGPEERDAAIAWIDGLLPGGAFDLREALISTVERNPLLDTVVIATDSHPWGSGRAEGSRETMEIFRRLNRTRDVRLVIALVMPGGRYEPSERSEAEIQERIDYLTEMAEDSGGAFVNVER